MYKAELADLCQYQRRRLSRLQAKRGRAMSAKGKTPKEIHDQEQEVAEMVASLRSLALAMASFFIGLVDSGLTRREALYLTGVQISGTAGGRSPEKDEGEDWKKGEDEE